MIWWDSEEGAWGVLLGRKGQLSELQKPCIIQVAAANEYVSVFPLYRLGKRKQSRRERDGSPSPSPVCAEYVAEVSHRNDEEVRVTWTEISGITKQLCAQSVPTFGKNRHNYTKPDKTT